MSADATGGDHRMVPHPNGRVTYCERCGVTVYASMSKGEPLPPCYPPEPEPADECGHPESQHYWTCGVCFHRPPYEPTTPENLPQKLAENAERYDRLIAQVRRGGPA